MKLDPRALARFGALACVAIVVALSLLPARDRPHLLHSGDIEHFAAYAGTALLAAYGHGRRGAVLFVLALSVAAAVFEVVQLWIPGRTSGIDNWAASTAGAVAGALVGRALLAVTRRRACDEPPADDAS